MAIGGQLTVQNSYDSNKNFNVTFPRNTKITNYRPGEAQAVGQVTATIENGQKGYAIKIFSQDDLNKEKTDKLRTLDLNTKRYNIFNTLRALDGNKNDISEQDLASAKKLVGKLGITNVRRDANAGVTTIVCDDGAVLRFDVETNAEIKTRKEEEANTKAKQDSINRQKALDEQNANQKLKENCKSGLQKFLEWIFN